MAEREMTMVERVARAICRVDLMAIAMEENITLSPNGLDASVNKAWRQAIPNARAAIEEMRENTPSMSEAMRMANMNIVGGYGGPSGWEAAIDAALKEQEGEK